MDEKIKIIVAEDNDILRKNLINNLMLKDDFEIVGDSNSGIGIVEIARNIDFDIAILDIDMETSMAGIVAGGQILAIKPDAKLIFLSVHQDDELVFMAMDIGAVDYIIKSNDSDILTKHIIKAFDNKVEMEWNVQMKLQKEFVRLRKHHDNIIMFVKSLSLLTEAERELIRLIYEGNNLREISKIRFVELTTTKTQVSRILKKMDASKTKEIIEKIKELKVEYLLYQK